APDVVRRRVRGDDRREAAELAVQPAEVVDPVRARLQHPGRAEADAGRAVQYAPVAAPAKRFERLVEVSLQPNQHRRLAIFHRGTSRLADPGGVLETGLHAD